MDHTHIHSGGAVQLYRSSFAQRIWCSSKHEKQTALPNLLSLTCRLCDTLGNGDFWGAFQLSPDQVRQLLPAFSQLWLCSSSPLLRLPLHLPRLPYLGLINSLKLLNREKEMKPSCSLRGCSLHPWTWPHCFLDWRWQGIPTFCSSPQNTHPKLEFLPCWMRVRKCRVQLSIPISYTRKHPTPSFSQTKANLG